jgi:hypothetical protein
MSLPHLLRLEAALAGMLHDEGEHNYFFMFKAKLLSSPGELRANTSEIDDARFFSKEEMDALPVDETWAGASAVAYKALAAGCTLWLNDAGLAADSGVDTPDRWRIWM